MALQQDNSLETKLEYSRVLNNDHEIFLENLDLFKKRPHGQDIFLVSFAGSLLLKSVGLF